MLSEGDVVSDSITIIDKFTTWLTFFPLSITSSDYS